MALNWVGAQASTPFYLFIISDGTWQRTKNGYVTIARDVANIFYSADNEDNLCGYHEGVLNQYYTLFTCRETMTGRFVQFQILTGNYLNLYEVEVHGN